LLQATGWLFLAYLTYAQLIPAFDFQLGVEMGTQESAAQITEVGVAYFKGFAFGDLVTYAPLLLAGLIGHFLRQYWGRIALAAALGITVYWPIVSLQPCIRFAGLKAGRLETRSNIGSFCQSSPCGVFGGSGFYCKRHELSKKGRTQ
jgi:hypothetical protein